MWFQVLHTPLSCPSAAQPAPKQCMFWNGTLMQNQFHCEVESGVCSTLFPKRRVSCTALLTVRAAGKCSDKFNELSLQQAVPPFGNYCSESINPARFSASHASKERWEAVAAAFSCPPAQLAAGLYMGLLAIANLYFSGFTIHKLAFLW